MNNKMAKKVDAVLEPMMNADLPPVMPEPDLATNTQKIPLSNLFALGVAFQPLTAAIQTAIYIIIPLTFPIL